LFTAACRAILIITSRTAETFHAAATFLDLLAIWQTPLNEEVAAKAKYSRYHAMRILKALKAGEDPNLTTEVADEPVQQPLDPNDPEVQKIKSMQPTVQDAPSPMDEDPPAQYSSHPQPSNSHTAGDVSPMEPEQSNDDYFPSNVPTFIAETSPNVATAPVSLAPTLPVTPNTQVDAQNFYSNPAPLAPPVVAQAPLPIPMATTIPVTTSHSQQYAADDEGILAAQKHARWAISALNFDDVPTAVKELKMALQRLGA
jgi:vacuolar protein sorting-associated protein VTA1